MRESFDPFVYLGYLQRSWKPVAVTCLLAALVAAAISWIMPNRYTATATILIDAPAGNDPRAATAVSPIYLESLRTYERFAASDSLFLRAVDRFQLRSMFSSSADSMKKQILRVSKPRDTKLLEIEVTLTDAAKSQAVAQFLAEETVRLNQSLTQQADEEFMKAARTKLEAAQARYDAALKLRNEDSERAQVDAIQWELQTLTELRGRLLADSASARADAADYSAQGRDAKGLDTERIRSRAAGAEARLQATEKELKSVEAQIATKQRILAQRRIGQERLEAEQAMSRTGYDAAAHRVDDVAASAGIRGERLRIIDPGVVPEKPSSPRTVLNILGAVFAALLLSLLYVTFSFVSGMRTRISEEERLPVYR